MAKFAFSMGGLPDFSAMARERFIRLLLYPANIVVCTVKFVDYLHLLLCSAFAMAEVQEHFALRMPAAVF